MNTMIVGGVGAVPARVGARAGGAERRAERGGGARRRPGRQARARGRRAAA